MRNLFHLLVASAVILTAVGVGCSKQEPAKQLPATAPKQASSTLPFHTFENGNDGWYGVKGVSVNSSPEIKHSEQGGLHISGTSKPPYWNYAKSPKFQLQPNTKYKLSGWMYVRGIEDRKYPPYLKIDISQNGKWITNKNTNKYDLSKLSQWQELSITFTSLNTPGIEGFLAVEKGTRSLPLSVDLFLDDVKIEIAN